MCLCVCARACAHVNLELSKLVNDKSLCSKLGFIFPASVADARRPHSLACIACEILQINMYFQHLMC